LFRLFCFRLPRPRSFPPQLPHAGQYLPAARPPGDFSCRTRRPASTPALPAYASPSVRCEEIRTGLSGQFRLAGREARTVTLFLRRMAESSPRMEWTGHNVMPLPAGTYSVIGHLQCRRGNWPVTRIGIHHAAFFCGWAFPWCRGSNWQTPCVPVGGESGSCSPFRTFAGFSARTLVAVFLTINTSRKALNNRCSILKKPVVYGGNFSGVPTFGGRGAAARVC